MPSSLRDVWSQTHSISKIPYTNRTLTTNQKYMPLVIRHSNPETPDQILTPPYEKLEENNKTKSWFDKVKQILKKKKK